MKINILALAVIISVSATADAQYIADPYLYYSVGGGRATTPTIIDPNVRFGFRASSSGFACGNFDPKLDIRSMLGGVGNSMADLGSLKSSLTGALPGQILCRAQPSLCQLMQHYTVRAEDQWRFSIDACELLQQTSAGGPNANSDWQALGKAQTWERLAQTGASDAVSIQQKVSEETDPCVTWVEGKEAGCPGKPAIKPVRDAVRAGWCASNGLPADCDTTINPKTTDRSAASTWSSPNQAAEFTADIVGDSEIRDGGTPSSHVASGLQPKVDEEKIEVLETLQQVLASGNFPDQAQAEKLHAPSVAVNFQLILALREVDQHGVYAERLAEEIALARVVEKALQSRRLLLTGATEPNIQNSGPANEALITAVGRLEQEIDRIIFDYQMRRSLVSDTSVALLEAYERTRTPTVAPREIFPTTPLQ